MSRRRKRRGTADKVHFGENVYAAVTHHEKDCKLVEAGAAGLYLPDTQCDCGALFDEGRTEIVVGANIVTDAGDQYYAELGAGEVTTNFATPTKSVTTVQNAPSKTSDFADLTTIPASGTKAVDGSYPQTDDADADNPGTTGIDIVTWRTSWGTGEANGTIIGIAIHNTGATGTDPLLMHAAFGASFVKTTADTLKTYVNHRMNGV